MSDITERNKLLAVITTLKMQLAKETTCADELKKLVNNWVAWYEMYGIEHSTGCLFEESLIALKNRP